MTRQGGRSSNRTTKRGLSKQFDASLSAMAQHLNKTPVHKKIAGWEMTCGDMTIPFQSGKVTWQLKLVAIPPNGKKMKKPGIQPMFDKFSLLFRVRAWFTHMTREME